MSDLEGTHAALVEALRAYDACDREGYNVPERLREAIEELAVEVGGDGLVRHRPGCWEAAHVLALAAGWLWRSPAPEAVDLGRLGRRLPGRRARLAGDGRLP